jgi:hypothetical protein
VNAFTHTDKEDRMATTWTWRRRLVVPLLAAAAVALPLGLRPDGSLGARDACAQSGSCTRSDNICVFIRDNAYPGTWEGA